MLAWFDDKSHWELLWIGVGFFGQALFSMRFLLQWIASERARKSIVPELFRSSPRARASASSSISGTSG
jgi:lipid-A-disaccharide synthase-like uncharacterized protein